MFKIDSTSGQILWRLGGKHSDFTFPDDPLGGPSMQHGVRELPNGNLLMFDNGNEHTPPQSRAVEYALDVPGHVAHLVWSYAPQPAVFAGAMGFAQRLTTGDTLITYGTLGLVQQVNPLGEVTWQMQASTGVYRATRIDSLY